MSQGEPVAFRGAWAVAVGLVGALETGCERIEIAGSLRRGKPEVHDIEIVAVARIEERPDGLFGTTAVDLLEERIAALMANGNLAPRMVENHRADGRVDVGQKLGPAFKALITPRGIAVDLFVVRSPASWGCIYALRTGPGDWNTRLVTECKAIGRKVEGGQVWRWAGSAWVTVPTPGGGRLLPRAGPSVGRARGALGRARPHRARDRRRGAGMSRKRVVVGVDERGRPLTAWAKPEAADEPRYGHMEPAFAAPIERRVATPSQRAWNGGPIQARLAATPTPTREEPTMPETPPQAAQEPTPSPAGADVQLDRLSAAAEAARQAWDAVAVAQTAWQVASEDLARAYADVVWVLDVPAAIAAERFRRVLATPPKGNTAAQSRANGTASMLAKRAKAAPGAKAREAQEKTDRAARVMAAMARLGGDQRAVAADLGMRTNAVAMVVKHARARGEADVPEMTA